MFSSSKSLKEDSFCVEQAKQYQQQISAILGAMIGPDGRNYLETYLHGGVHWLWDGWLVDWENAHHQATLLPPSREQTKALKRLKRQLFLRSCVHHFMWLPIKIGRFFHGHH